MACLPVPLPTMREFIKLAIARGCQYKTLPAHVIGPRGPTVIRYLIGLNGVPRALQEIDQDTPLTPIVISNLERALGLPQTFDIAP